MVFCLFWYNRLRYGRVRLFSLWSAVTRCRYIRNALKTKALDDSRWKVREVKRRSEVVGASPPSSNIINTVE